jgi:hypothetical protein
LEVPKEHWEPLKDGSSCLNFLKFPEPKIHDNAVMDAEQTQVAVGFVEELLVLLVILTPLEGHAILTNAPLFMVPKEGEEGEYWRVIADMLRGGQNECIEGDPVILPWISHILDQMYANGYSVVGEHTGASDWN